MTAPAGAPTASATPPVPADRDDVVDVLHGRTVPDPYRWLEDPADERTLAWSAAQDALWQAHRSGAAAAEDRFRARLSELLAAGSTGAPVWRGEVHLRSRRAGDAEHPVLEVVAPDGGTRVLVDPLAVDPSGGTTLDGWQPSVEGDLLAYQLSTGGTEESVLRVLDVATGEVVDGPVDRARYSPVAWLPGGRAFYYVRRLDPALVPEDERQYHRRVWLHRVGTSPDTDVEVFGAGQDRTSYYGVSVSRDGRWLVVSASAGTAPRTDVWIADLTASAPEAPDWREVVVGQDAETAAWVARDGRLLLHTDLGAPRGRLCVADPAHPGPEHWRTLLPEDPEAVLHGVVLLDDGGEAPTPATELVALRRRHALSEVTVHDPVTGAPLPGPGRDERGRLPLGVGTVTGLTRRPTGGRELWFGWTATTTPTRIHRWDARTGVVDVWAEPPGALPDLPDVVTRQLVCTSADGTDVRMTVVVRADLLDGDRPREPLPTILYGYGGFQISLEPAYSATALAWVEAGGAYVTAHLRGGGEEGEEWHRAGMRGKKQNVFDDAHAVAEHLLADGWTTSDRLAVWGGSNGGLLVGAVVTQRPELVAAAVCSAPLLDMVRYQRFGLGVTWTEEYGDADDAEQLAWLLAYSPYHRALGLPGPVVGRGEGPEYPAVLFTVFEGDTRVDPLHARKTCAALQHATSGDAALRPVLLRRETGVGHGGRSLSRTIGLAAEQLAFVARHTTLPDPV